MEKLTPMMAQYKAIKGKYADCILMFRLGDFYEMFFEDAVEASKILQIALTSRNKGGAAKAPMCGIPYHAVDQYLPKLTRAGKKVAICDQVTEPDGKGNVERDVVRVVKPGTTFDDNILENKANNYVACVVAVGEGFGFAYADVTTGDFKATEVTGLEDLEAELAKVRPAECICEDVVVEDFKEIFKKVGTIAFPFSYLNDAEKDLKDHFEIKALKIFGLEEKEVATIACGMLLSYLKETQKTDLEHIQGISFYDIFDTMPLDNACIRNLELFFTSRGEKDGSLLSVLDQTMTSMGGRMLRNWMLNPLLESSAISERLGKVEIFVKDSSLLRDVREKLNGFYDIERLLSRLSLGTGNARDLVAMKQSLALIPEIKSLVSEVGLSDGLHDLKELVELIEKAIVDEPPMSVRDGGMIKNGFNKELDELLSISTEGKTFITEMQKREITRTGINSLKVKFNKVFGYYLEVSKSNLANVPDDYIRKQTLVNAERFITPELKEYEEKVLTAEDRIKELSYALFYEVRMEVVKEIVRIQQVAKTVGALDLYANFAFIAEKNSYCKPEISDDGGLEIVDGRHPVIEQVGFGQDFVPNDCKMDDESEFFLITGPNMGGKSTYLRQVALIVMMAQIGSFVPAKSARIGVVDRIFTRVGASDNLVAGESTFMVEMQEASYILNHAGPKSLIILDELGRGTSTYDGVSIAWAICEFIHDNVGAKTLFATHYHELIELADGLPRAVNLSVAVRENQDEGVVFLYKIVAGGVDKSYGIEVAKLAGLPVDIISRARGVLSELETKHIKKLKLSPDQQDLFDKDARKHKGILKDLNEIDVDSLTPLEALQKLNEMKKRSRE